MYDLSIVDPADGEAIEGPFEDGRRIRLVYPCPFCEHAETDILTTPLDEYEQGACDDCARTYLITAQTLPLDVEDTLYNRIAYQLQSLTGIEEFRQREPDYMQYLSVAPENLVLAIVITSFALSGIIGLSVAFPQAIQTDVRFAIGFTMLLVAVSLGVLTALATSVGALYRASLHIRAFELDVSLREFVLYAANVRGVENPYLIRQDIF